MVELDGKVVYACTARLIEGDMHIAPLRKKALIQDLVTEVAPPDERL
jgi:succinate dehydrogenase/fumarate reductase-like Fe-S protein